ncbi:hypothetical protein FQN54_000022 [Arachnomyces sp. PD_36]|nr:hypothetical protein FQN54_000022 [Arachnomyces sp. PD_36]
MASATGIPQEHPDDVTASTSAAASRSREHEPLLGKPGDVTQSETVGIQNNLITGTASVAQAGVWILAALTWSGIFSHDLNFFSPHPLLNSSAILLQTQAILILQPTHTAKQKVLGTRIHFATLVLSNAAFLAALIIIEINKASHPESRFSSPHGILGLITYILILLQALVGVSQYFFPRLLFGSVEKGKSIYKWHRVFGYFLLLLELVTVIAATRTAYNVNVLHIHLWAVIVASVLVLLGVGARAKIHKLPFGS